jgi:hypothetical protein
MMMSSDRFPGFFGDGYFPKSAAPPSMTCNCPGCLADKLTTEHKDDPEGIVEHMAREFPKDTFLALCESFERTAKRAGMPCGDLTCKGCGQTARLLAALKRKRDDLTKASSPKPDKVADSTPAASDPAKTPDAATNHVYATGAVRSSDADDVRYDLISPVALQLVAMALTHPDGFPSVWPASKESMLSDAMHKINLALSGASPMLLLSFAAIRIMLAIQGKEPFRYERLTTFMEPPEGRFDLIPPKGLEALARTYHEGSIKYAAKNWEKGMPAESLLNHAIRHIYLALSGDTSEDHLGHALWNVMAAIHSVMLWPHLNKELRRTGCVPPNVSDAEAKKWTFSSTINSLRTNGSKLSPND